MSMPKPTTSKDARHTSPRDVFLYLLLFATLYAAVVSYLTLLFQYVNFRFPEPLSYFPAGILNTIRLASSFLIVSWPVYLLLAWITSREIRKTPDHRGLGIRKWLVYLTLFVAALTLIGDMISLVYNFYSGGLSTRFALKIIAILVVGAAVFGYYIWNLHTADAEKTKIPRNIGILTSAIILASIVAGFFIVGSPAEQRKIRFDEQRVNDLQNLENQIGSYYADQGALPNQLSDLEKAPMSFTLPSDPATKSVYDYIKKDATHYELCTNFETTIQTDVTGQIIPVRSNGTTNWNHNKVGRFCFERTVTTLPTKSVD